MAKKQLFFDTNATPIIQHPTPASQLAVAALQFDQRQMSPEQKRFNQLLKQTETLASKIEETRQLTDAHRRVVVKTLHPLEQQRNTLVRETVIWLDERLQRKGLRAKQKKMAREILCDMAYAMAQTGDALMQKLHDAHSKVSMANQQKEAEANFKSLIKDFLGDPTGPDNTDNVNFDHLFQASMAKMQEQAAAREAAQAQKKSKRKKTATQIKAQAAAAAQLADATSALRTIYRQLVGALHPDREPDPQEQLRKTALMKEVNTAYNKRDLLALLQLQLRTELTQTDQLAHLAKEKLTALTTLLKDRVRVLTQELHALEQRISDEFNLPYYRTVSAATLRRHLAEQERDLQGDIRQMELDMAMLDDDTFFKHWLHEQTDAATLAGLDIFDGLAPIDDFNPFFDDLDPFDNSKSSKRSCPF